MPEARVSSTTPTTVMGGFVLNLRPIGLATPGHRRFAAVALTMTTRGSPRSLAVNTRPDLRRIPSVPKYSGVMARARDPYRIWVSEIMLQQTRAEAVIPYYQ